MNFLGGRYYSEEELASAGFKSVGKNVKIHNRSSIYCPENISIGDNVRIDDYAVIIGSGSLCIENNVQICNYCFLGCTAGIAIKSYSTLAPGVMIFSSSDDYSGEYMTNPTLPGSLTGGKKGLVLLEQHVIVGAGSVILPGVILHEGVSVGALSLVKTTLDAWCIYAGQPVKFLKKRSDKLLDKEKIYTASLT